MKHLIVTAICPHSKTVGAVRHNRNMSQMISGAIVLGAGLEGAALAEHILVSGFPVYVATRKSRDELRPELEAVAPGAIATQLSDLPDLPADYAVFLAIPLSGVEKLDPRILAHRIVVDLTNYWPRLDDASSFAAAPRQSSMRVAELLPQSHVVKTLNHMAHLDMSFDARPRTDGYRRAQAIAGDDAASKEAVARFLDALGFDAVDAGPLANGRFFGAGTEIFNGGWRTADQIARIISRRSETPATPYRFDD